MVKISETLRGLPSQFSAQAQSVGQKLGSPIQTVKTGFFGDNGTLELSDLKPVASNIKDYGLVGGLAKTLFGYFKPETAPVPTSTGGQLPQFNFGSSQPQFNFGYDTMQPTTGADQYQGFTRYNPFAPTQYDMSGMMQMINAPISNMFQTPTSSPSQKMFTSGSMPRSSMIQNELPIHDIVNKIEVPTDSGLQMPQEEQAPQAQAPQQAPPPVAPKITPTKMPMPSDLDFIMGRLDPRGQSAYQSRSAPKYVNPMTANGGYFDMNKAGTVGGNYIQGAGWLTGADKAFGKKAEDLAFEAEMRQRIQNMYQ